MSEDVCSSSPVHGRAQGKPAADRVRGQQEAPEWGGRCNREQSGCARLRKQRVLRISARVRDVRTPSRRGPAVEQGPFRLVVRRVQSLGSMCSMRLLYDRFAVFCSLPLLIVLSGCDAGPECDSIQTRNAVLQIVSDDHRNPLVNYAAKNSTAKPNLENTKPLYVLGEKIVTTSTSQDKRTLQCSGAISVSVGDVKASKQVDFTVQQSQDGKLSVSVAPFQF
jgi:hypothetical protein